MGETFVGKGIDRVDARQKVTGVATYAAEVPVANVAHAVLVTSGAAKGRIARLDADDARRAIGVLAVLTHETAPKLPGADKKSGPVDRKLQLLQDDQILYSDQPIAVVVADTLEHAQYAASLVHAQYDEAPAAARIDSRLSEGYKPKATPLQTSRIRSEAIRTRRSAQPRRGWTRPTARPPRTTTRWSRTPPSRSGAATTISRSNDATQGIFGVRKRIATIFGLEPANVRVINRFVGGGFGCKGTAWSHVPLAALAAKVVGRPVKLVVTRPQMFSIVGHRPQTIQHLQLGANADGTLVAVRHDVVSETSSFDEFIEPSAVQTRMLYACPNVATSHRLVRIDIGTPTFQRAPGESTGTFALESAMDELAYAARIDPLELRLRNYAERDPEDDKPWSSKSLRACYHEGAKRFGWERRNPQPRSTRDGRWLVGWGMATATYPARQSASSAVARARPDGTMLVQAGSQDIGTGTYTIMTQIAADALGVPMGRVRFELGDTDLPETPVSGGSQTASSTGSAVKMACLELRKKAIVLVGGDPSAPPDYVAAVTRSGTPELVAEFHTQEKEERKSHSCHSFGAAFAEVRVDSELGEVRVSRFVGAFAAGKILNAKTARSQLLGGVVWAIGMALEEQTVRDPRSARVVTRDLADYHVPVNADVPAIEIVTIDEDDPYVNEIGAKGIGEIGITGASAAIANAVFHATGKRVRDLPITLDKLL